MSKHIVVAVTGGIAAYKAATVVRTLIKDGWDVRVMMTNQATKFVTPLTFTTLTGHAVVTTLGPANQPLAHVELARWADAMVVVPATANVLSKVALGIADDVVTTTLCAAVCPRLFIPAMNDQMYANPAVQRNITRLRADGARVMEPATGMLAEGYAGKGRLPAPAEISTWLYQQLVPGTALAGKHVLVTAGPTREYLDPIRYITNPSSGRMGYALAAAARNQGAEVTLVSGPTALPPVPGVTLVAVQTSAEMAQAVFARQTQADIIIAAAAVADYGVKHPAPQKIKKNGAELTLHLHQTKDIIATVAQNKRPDQYVVGFAAETTAVAEHARAKLQSKQLDMVVANDVGKQAIGFGSRKNAVTIFTPEETPQAVAQASKQTIAATIIQAIARHLGQVSDHQ
ncbi:bifunctional phosphopantothenoylcysteine decarboxylase/phosphopantothenate--cysteine ligase CoaBC [Ligilactobacillus sp. LYQ60]|uniref:bifunctional phosphopantothenoylcysteine decarboxylase/phosphopantothenate--cysteine ligase CoaBC n=1 Tax=unclassified Ligilactobacillus TaxID=2767920 RepID=UPI0038529440